MHQGTSSLRIAIGIALSLSMLGDVLRLQPAVTSTSRYILLQSSSVVYYLIYQQNRLKVGREDTDRIEQTPTMKEVNLCHNFTSDFDNQRICWRCNSCVEQNCHLHLLRGTCHDILVEQLQHVLNYKWKKSILRILMWQMQSGQTGLERTNHRKRREKGKKERIKLFLTICLICRN